MEVGVGDGNSTFCKDINVVQEILKESVTVENVHNLHTKLNNINELTDNLIICQAASINAKLIKTMGITCVINAAPELPDAPLNFEKITTLKVPIFDAPNSDILAHFDETSDLIQKIAEEDGKTIVYCVAGVSRSASLCIAYLMKHQKMSLLESYNYVKQKRPRIKPNCSFFKQLIEYERRLFGYNTVKMVYNDLINMEIPEVYDEEYKFCTYIRKKITRSK